MLQTYTTNACPIEAAPFVANITRTVCVSHSLHSLLPVNFNDSITAEPLSGRSIEDLLRFSAGVAYEGWISDTPLIPLRTRNGICFLGKTGDEPAPFKIFPMFSDNVTVEDLYHPL